jgi:hypothetical protein
VASIASEANLRPRFVENDPLRKLLVLALCMAALAGDAGARSNAADVKLLVYSNWPHPRVFLGCLNCAATDPTSVWNPTSRYGWTNPTGLWRRSGPYRNPDNRNSACNNPAVRPPAVFDQLWSFYYTLSIDPFRRGSICSPGMSHQGCAAVVALCRAA